MSEGELREKVKQLINARPYYICKRSDSHHDLQSQIGPMAGEYSRREDRLNEEYLEEAIMELIAQQCAAARKKGKLEAATYFKKYMVSTSPFIREILDPYIENSEVYLNVPTPKAASNDHNAPDGAERNV